MSEYLLRRRALSQGLTVAKTPKEIEKEERKAKPLKRSTEPIAKVSDKQKKRLQEYEKIRVKFLKEKKQCEIRLPGCTMKATDVHHISGRSAELLTDSSQWLAVCRQCHTKTHDNDQESREAGTLKSRITTVKK